MWTPLPREVMSYFVPPASGSVGDWNATFAEIDEFRTLTYDYDGQRAVPPSAAVFDAVTDLAEGLRAEGIPPPTCVVPGGDGSLNLEWDLPGDVLMTNDVDDAARAEVYVVVRSVGRGQTWALRRTGTNGTAGATPAASGIAK